MAWRKYGAIRFGMVFATALVATNQSISVDPLTIAVTLPGQTDSATPGTSIQSIPYQRPVAQRGIRRFGFVPGSAATATTSLSAGPLSTVVTLPTATATAGGSSLGVSPLSAVVTLPTAVRSAGGVSLATAPLVDVVTLPGAAAAAGAASLATTPLVTVVTLPAVTVSASSAGVPLAVHYRRPVAQRGIQFYGPPSYSTTPEANQTVTVTPLVAVVTLPTATATAAGDTRLPPQLVRIRTVKQPYRTVSRPYVAAHGAIDEIVNEAQTVSVNALVVAVRLPAVTVTSTTLEPQRPQVYRTRFVKSTRVETRRLVKSYGYLRPPAAGADQSASASPLIDVVTLPTATATAGTATIQTTPLVVVVTLPTASAGSGGGTTPSASPLVTVVTLPTAALSAGAATVATTPLVAAVTLPDAAASAGAVTRTVTPLVVAVTLPTAISTRAVAVSPLVTSVSLPTATLTVGAASVATTPLVAVVSLVSPRVLGATTLPDIVEAVLESRMQERTLSRRNGDRIVEFNG
jgi:hypothetical protein